METRIRRGELVEVPKEWQGVVTYKQTIRKRRSKWSKAARKHVIRKNFTYKFFQAKYRGVFAV